MMRALVLALGLIGLTALALDPPPARPRPALRVYPTQTNGWPIMHEGECAGDAGITGSRGEAVTWTRATPADCTQTDGGVIQVVSGQPVLTGGAMVIRGAGTNADGGTRNADEVYTPNPLAAAPANPATYGICVTVTPSVAWASWPASPGLAQIGASGNNRGYLYFSAQLGLPRLDIYGGVGSPDTIRSAIGDVAMSIARHEVCGCVHSAVPSVWIDGAKVAQTLSGTGSGNITAQPATLWIGALGAANHAPGPVSDWRVLRGSCP